MPLPKRKSEKTTRINAGEPLPLTLLENIFSSSLQAKLMSFFDVPSLGKLSRVSGSMNQQLRESKYLSLSRNAWMVHEAAERVVTHPGACAQEDSCDDGFRRDRGKIISVLSAVSLLTSFGIIYVSNKHNDLTDDFYEADCNRWRDNVLYCNVLNSTALADICDSICSEYGSWKWLLVVCTYGDIACGLVFLMMCAGYLLKTARASDVYTCLTGDGIQEAINYLKESKVIEITDTTTIKELRKQLAQESVADKIRGPRIQLPAGTTEPGDSKRSTADAHSITIRTASVPGLDEDDYKPTRETPRTAYFDRDHRTHSLNNYSPNASLLAREQTGYGTRDEEEKDEQRRFCVIQ